MAFSALTCVGVKTIEAVCESVLYVPWKVEPATSEAAEEVENVICHEFYVVEGHYVAVFLTKK